MGRRISKLLLIGIFIALFVSCAEAPKTIQREDVQGIKKMAVVTFLSGQGVDISHQGGLTLSPHAAAFGVLGVLIGSAVEKAAIQSSLSNYSDMLNKEFANYNPKAVLDEAFSRLFEMNFETIDPLEVEKLGTGKYPEKENKEGRKIKDYQVLRDKLGVDSVLQIDFTYGLEVQGRTLSTAVISAELTVIRINDNAVLLNKQVSSSRLGKTWHTIDEFMKDNAQIYKRELSNASEAIVYLTGLELGVNLGSKRKFYWQQEESGK